MPKANFFHKSKAGQLKYILSGRVCRCVLTELVSSYIFLSISRLHLQNKILLSSCIYKTAQQQQQPYVLSCFPLTNFVHKSHCKILDHLYNVKVLSNGALGRWVVFLKRICDSENVTKGHQILLQSLNISWN